jgi:Ca2+-binding RTX toxin-like protein
MASVTAGHALDMSVVHRYALTIHNWASFEIPSFSNPVIPVYFFSPEGIVDVDATISFFFLDIPSPITSLSVYTNLTPVTSDLAYSVHAPSIPAQPIYEGWRPVGKLVTVNFAYLLRGDDSITGSSWADKLLGFGGSDSISGMAGNDLIFGGAGNDFINGGAGNDLIDGGPGSDILAGGEGDDLLILYTTTDVVVENPGEGSDTVRLAYNVTEPTLIDLTSAYGGNVENVQAVGTGRFNLTGNAEANRLTSNASINILIGGAGDDTLDGRLGGDTLIGEAGDDTYVVDNSRDTFTENPGEGTDTVRINRSVNLNVAPFFEIENVVLTGVTALNATGDSGDNILTGNTGANILTGGDGNDMLVGNAGNDKLDGGAGGDAMDGGAGNDIFIVDDPGDAVTETLMGAVGGTDLVQSAVTFTLGSNVERLTLTGTADVNGTGNDLNNILAGNNGTNLLDGGAGADKLAGGLGNDIYVADMATDVVTELADAGVDTVQASSNYTLGANIENLMLTGSANLNGTGNTLDNILAGNSGNNILISLAGDDQLDGGDGNDTLDGGVGQDTVMGGEGDDRITMLVTVDNVDTIDAGEGTDTLVLSGIVPGNHEVVVDLSEDDQVVSIGGVAEGLSQLNFENLNAAGIGSFVTAAGSDDDNVIIGSKGNDTIEGGAGNDTLTGGLGGDHLQGGTGNDLVLLNSVAEFARGEVIDGGGMAQMFCGIPGPRLRRSPSRI